MQAERRRAIGLALCKTIRSPALDVRLRLNDAGGVGQRDEVSSFQYKSVIMILAGGAYVEVPGVYDHMEL